MLVPMLHSIKRKKEPAMMVVSGFGRELPGQRAGPVSSVKATSLHLSVPQFTSYKMTDKRNSEGFGSFETL